MAPLRMENVAVLIWGGCEYIAAATVADSGQRTGGVALDVVRGLTASYLNN
jgi:hypothetical protein